MAKIDEIKKGVDEIKKRLLIAEPAHFSRRDMIDSFFGALFLGLTFSMKGLLIKVSQSLTALNITLITISTLLILTGEIYFIGYKTVTKKIERKFGQFWFKRIAAFYSTSLITSIFLVYVFALNRLPEIGNQFLSVFKLVILISMPCAIGAAITDLLKKY